MERNLSPRRDSLDAQKLQDDLYLNWWGLLRRPPVYTERPIKRREMLTAGILGAAGFFLVWALGLFVVHRFVGLAALTVEDVLLFSAIALGLPVVIALLLPLPKDRKSAWGQWIIAAREQGNLRRWDMAAFLVSVFGTALAVAGFLLDGLRDAETPARQPAAMHVLLLILGGASIAGTAALRLSVKAPFVSRWRRAPLPPWLAVGGETVTEPDPEASFVYAFPAKEDADTEVGVHVPADVLSALSKINMDAGGRLYEKDNWKGALAVVIGQDPPVNGLGTEEFKRLIRQLWGIAGKHRWSRFQYAAQLLRFVQRSISYEHDGPSTQRLLGKSFKEYGRFPLETLCHGVGDCECTAILGAALLSYSGYPCALFHVTIKDSPFEAEVSHHVALGLLVDEEAWLPTEPRERDRLGFVTAGGRRYLYGETATDSADPEGFGVMPENWAETMEFVRTVPIPVAAGGARPRSS